MGSQNGVLVEEAAKLLLADLADATKLVRRSACRLKRGNAYARLLGLWKKLVKSATIISMTMALTAAQLLLAR